MNLMTELYAHFVTLLPFALSSQVLLYASPIAFLISSLITNFLLQFLQRQHLKLLVPALTIIFFFPFLLGESNLHGLGEHILLFFMLFAVSLIHILIFIYCLICVSFPQPVFQSKDGYRYISGKWRQTKKAKYTEKDMIGLLAILYIVAISMIAFHKQFSVPTERSFFRDSHSLLFHQFQMTKTCMHQPVKHINESERRVSIWV